MDHVKENVLQENDRYANRFMISVLSVSCGIFFIILFLFETELFTMWRGNYRFSILSGLILMLTAIAISVYFKHDRHWIKYMLMGVLIVAYAMIDAVFTFYASILMVIPVVMSSRYFSRKYTIVVAGITYVTFFISTIWGANHGMLDLNALELPVDTVINLGNNTWLSDAMADVTYDKQLMIRNSLGYTYAIKLFLSLITSLASIRVADQGRKMVLRQQKLSEETASVETELDAASKIQKAMLPGIFPAFPDHSEFDLYASMKPALMVGGDFYDFFLVDNDHLALVIADVSDKGIAAAMFMVLSKNTIANNVISGKSPAKALDDANKMLCVNNTENMFVTAWLGILQISTGLLTVCNAGHEPPVFLHRDVIFRLLRDEHGAAMGCVPDIDYMDYTIQLVPGDKLFLYTDGVPEAANKDLQQLGIDPVIEALNDNIEASPRQMLENVQARIEEFVQEAEQFDDITMLALEYKGKKQE